MRIKITEENKEAIDRELKKVNGNNKSFAITDSLHLARIVEKAEEKLFILTKASRNGAGLIYCPKGPPSGSSKRRVKSTRVICERGENGWFLCGVFEAELAPKQPAQMLIGITSAQSYEIYCRAIEPFLFVK